ncbi:MAG: aminoacetone oxidase family FAD-binding enzyme [Bacilli bacterium]|nr:aminoacetone oxidase family FAD-binding enzyme [Bacilli bacterium]
MARIIILGGGASGMVAAIKARTEDNEVIIIDKNNNLGKKILMTGNGKCNYWNRDINVSHYNSDNLDILEKIITEKNKLKIEEFFDRLGITPRIKDNYYYPSSNQATSIQTALILECELRGVKIFNNEEVINVKKKNNIFEVITNKRNIECDKVVLAMGSKACSKTGSDGLGYKIANSFGHTLIEPLPALVQLKLKASFLKEWQGIRCDAKVSLYENNKLVKEDIGEVQLTDYGISGICVYQLSGRVSRGIYKNKKEDIEINFLNSLEISDEEEFVKLMDERNKIVVGRNVSQLLDGILNYKLINLILKNTWISRDDSWDNISMVKKLELGRNLTKLRLNIIGTNSYDMAQVCSGGVKLDEINPLTMESLKTSGLYIVGELLDVDGECGGFNLGFAWISGYLAGKSISGDNND